MLFTHVVAHRRLGASCSVRGNELAGKFLMEVCLEIIVVYQQHMVLAQKHLFEVWLERSRVSSFEEHDPCMEIATNDTFSIFVSMDATLLWVTKKVLVNLAEPF